MTARRAFGSALRAERERRGITLETIARRTKIAPSLLAALERGDCSRWPGGIYSRAYVREYAVAIGLNREEVAARFSACFADTAFPDRGPAPESATAEPAPATPLRLTLGGDAAERRRRTILLRALVVVVDLFLMLATAAVLSTAEGVGFWAALACTSLTFHAIALAFGARSTSGLFARVSPGLTRTQRRHEPASGESAVAEPA